MIRPLTLICACIAAISGLYLYHVKHQTQLLERSIARASQSIDAARERTGVLRAEWTLMNDPERLAELAGQFLKLVTVSPRQFTTVADLGTRLPAIRALPTRPEATTDMPVTDKPETDMPTEGADPSVEAPLPLPPPAPPRAVAAAAPRSAATPVTATAAAVTVPAVAAARPAVTSLPAATPATPQPAVTRAVVQATPPPVPAQRSVSTPVSVPVGGVVMTGSALGMARGIVAPPIPVGGEIHLTRGN